MFKKINIDNINDVLKSYKQNLRVSNIEWGNGRNTKNYLILNTKLKLDYKEVSTFLRRIDNIHKIINFDNGIFDKIYLSNGIDNITENKLMLFNCSKAGKKAQKESGDKIRKNLNIGVPWNKDTKGLQTAWCKGLTKETNKSLKRLSENRIGSGNPMYGHKHSEEYKKEKSILMKEKILNGEFTPCVHNSRTHWESIYEGKKYRSTWELVFHYINPNVKYESTRISYFSKQQNKKRIYITDFTNEDEKIVYEIKPEKQISGNEEKFEAANLWCKENNYEFKIITESYFKQYLDIILESDIDDKIKKKFIRGM